MTQNNKLKTPLFRIIKRIIVIFLMLLIVLYFLNKGIKSWDGKKNIRIAAKEPVENKVIIDKDTSYVMGDFYFQAKKSMVFEFVKKGNRPTKKTVGDTLYHDDKVILLGDFEKIAGMGIYTKLKFKSKFDMYPVDSIYKGKLSKPNFETDPNAKEFRTRIKFGCNYSGVNFAGHYTIIEWGCGCACQEMAVVDRITGKIIYSKIPFDTADGHSGTDYRINSKMLIINTEALEIVDYQLNSWRKPAIYELENSKFIRIE